MITVVAVPVHRWLNIRRAQRHMWKYRPRWYIGPPDPKMLAQMEADGLFDKEDA